MESLIMNIGKQRQQTISTFLTWILCFLFFCIAGNIMAQGLDKESEKYVRKLQSKYAAHTGHDVLFEMTLQYPEEEPIQYEGHYWSKGDQYKIHVQNQIIVCDGSTQWVYDKTDKLITIYDADEAGFTISPKGVFDMLKSDEYTYALNFSGVKAGQKIDELELKPNEEFSDFFKARLTVLSDQLLLNKLETFYKDGSRMTLELKDFKIINPEDSIFHFDPSKYSGAEVEDLRW